MLANKFVCTLHIEFIKKHINLRSIFFDLLIHFPLFCSFFCMRYFRWAVDTFDTVWNPDNCELWVLVKDDRGRYSFNNQGLCIAHVWGCVRRGSIGP